MLQQLWLWVVGKLQVKMALLIISVMFLLLTLFLIYDLREQRRTLEDALLAKGENMAITGATAVGHVFEDAIATGRLTEVELFDRDYQPISNTTPQQYNTLYDSFTDENIQAILDSYLEDSDVLFAAATDVKGYAPTHNTIYSNPQTNNAEINLVNSRNKRIFDDPVGLAASKNIGSVLHQIYFRDTGELAWDISAPIWVDGRHWGAMRIGFSLARIDAQLTALSWRIGLAGFVLVLVVGLAAFLIAYLLARPVQELAGAARRIEQGELDVQIEVKSQDEVGQLANAFNDMAHQIKTLVDTLEQRVATRTQRLEIIAALSERLTGILDFDALLQELVKQVKDNFNYYHAHVYIVDDKGQNLIMIAGVGEAGEKMKAQSHQIALDAPTSLVARAARSGEIVSVDNVREVEDWLPNPLLPDTYSEMAVPIVVEDQIVGVLDVQEDKIAGLDEGDANVLRSLANQVAVAIRNARLFDEVKIALAEAHAAQERYLVRAWKQAKVTSQGLEQLYTASDGPPLDESSMVAAKKQALAKDKPAVISLDNHQSKSVVAPVIVGQQKIGALQLHRLTSEAQVDTWDEEDLALIQTVLDQVAQTAENLRLFEEIRQQASFEQLVNNIQQKLRQSPTLDDLIKTAAEELGNVLGASHGLITLGSNSNVQTDQLREISNGNNEIA